MVKGYNRSEGDIYKFYCDEFTPGVWEMLGFIVRYNKEINWDIADAQRVGNDSCLVIYPKSLKVEYALFSKSQKRWVVTIRSHFYATDLLEKLLKKFNMKIGVVSRRKFEKNKDYYLSKMKFGFSVSKYFYNGGTK